MNLRLTVCFSLALAFLTCSVARGHETVDTAGGSLPQPRIEIVEERGLFAKTFENQDGSTTVQLGAQPIHYRTGDGAYEEISTAFEADNGWVNMTNTIPLRLPSALGAGEAVLAGSDFSLRWQPGVLKARMRSGELVDVAEPELSEGEAVEGRPNTVRYRGIYPGIDLLFSVEAGQINLTLVLTAFRLDVSPDEVEALVIDGALDAAPDLLTSMETLAAERESLAEVPLHFGRPEDDYAVFIGSGSADTPDRPQPGLPPSPASQSPSGLYIGSPAWSAREYARTNRVRHAFGLNRLPPLDGAENFEPPVYAQLPFLEFRSVRWLRLRNEVPPIEGAGTTHRYARENVNISCFVGEGRINAAARVCRPCNTETGRCPEDGALNRPSATIGKLRKGFPLQLLGGSRFSEGQTAYQEMVAAIGFSGFLALRQKYFVRNGHRISGIALGYLPASPKDWQPIGPLSPDPSLMAGDANDVVVLLRRLETDAGIRRLSLNARQGLRPDGVIATVHRWQGPSQRKDGYVYTPLNRSAIASFSELISYQLDSIDLVFEMRSAKFRFFAMRAMRMEVTIERSLEGSVAISPTVLNAAGQPDPNAPVALRLGEAIDIQIETKNWRNAKAIGFQVANASQLLCGYGLDTEFWDQTGKQRLGPQADMGQLITNRGRVTVDKVRLRITRAYRPGRGCGGRPATQSQVPSWGDSPRIRLSGHFWNRSYPQPRSSEIQVTLLDSQVTLTYSNDPPATVTQQSNRGNARITSVSIDPGSLKGTSQVNFIVAIKAGDGSYLPSFPRRLYTWYENQTTAVPGVLRPGQTLEIHAHPANLSRRATGPFTVELYPCLRASRTIQTCPGHLRRNYRLELTPP
ncbi:MAG: hypothetical protein AAF441_03585 [Pseudomonadota bacterium]